MSRTDGPNRIWALVEPRTLAWLIALAVLVDGAAISPWANDAAASTALAHYTQHGVIYSASALLGGSLRDLARVRPFAARYVIGLGLLSLVGDIAALLPPLDNAIETNAALHEAQHAIVFLAGAAMGLALRDVILGRRWARLPPKTPLP